MTGPRLPKTKTILVAETPRALERTLWLAAAKLRSNVDAADYKQIVLSLIFLKHLSDHCDKQGTPPDPSKNVAGLQSNNLVRLPSEARWESLERCSKDPGIGKVLDRAIASVERDNPSLKGLLAKNYDRPGLDKRRLGELINLIGTLAFRTRGNRSSDILGIVYEYFLSQFAQAEARKGGQYYTPPCVGRLLVEMLAPDKGSVYDPCCGSGGIFIQIKQFVEAHCGHLGNLASYGQESNLTTWRLAKLNLAVHGIDGHLGFENADSFSNDLHKHLKADYVFANPPFNDSDWASDLDLENDPRWNYGFPPPSNANFAWIQHFIYHLAPNGFAGFVLTNGSLSNNRSGEGRIRRNIIEADLVDCVVALPGKLFYSTEIAVCLWILARNKHAKGFRDRSGETLFIDASKLGVLIDRAHGEIPDEQIENIALTYHAWRGDIGAEDYVDVQGFSKKVRLDQIAANDYLLTPNLYVDVETDHSNHDVLDQELPRLLDTLRAQFAEGARLQHLIEAKLRTVRYDR